MKANLGKGNGFVHGGSFTHNFKLFLVFLNAWASSIRTGYHSTCFLGADASLRRC